MSDDYEPRCDVCDITCEEVSWNNDEWCGECGCCAEHCQQYVDCPDRNKEEQ